MDAARSCPVTFGCLKKKNSSAKPFKHSLLVVSQSLRSYPAREESTVFELAQIEGDEEGSRHEHQGQQSGIRFPDHLHYLGRAAVRR